MERIRPPSTRAESQGGVERSSAHLTGSAVGSSKNGEIPISGKTTHEGSSTHFSIGHKKYNFNLSPASSGFSSFTADPSPDA